MIDEIFKKIKDDYRNLLKNNLVGIYLHGSIVFNCFNPESSDLDFIVVVNEQLDAKTKTSLIKTLLTINNVPKKGFEMSVVLKKYCLNFEYPTPYELHFSGDSNLENLVTHDFKTDPDLAAHFTIIKAYGQVLWGQPILEVFGEIKKEYYVSSIYNDIVNAKEEVIKQPTYIILNLCRVLAYLKDDQILSKAQGGLWGLENLKGEYQPILESAMNSYLKNIEPKIAAEAKIEFAEYMLSHIKDYLELIT